MMAESLKNSVNFLLNNKESQANEYFFNDAIKKLKPEDRALPQVNINVFKLLLFIKKVFFLIVYYKKYLQSILVCTMSICDTIQYIGGVERCKGISQ